MKFILSFACIVFLCACSRQDAQPGSDYSKRIAELENRLLGIEEVVGMHSKLIPAGALMDATSKEYQVIYTVHGPYTISVDEARQYLDGYKLRLKIGNLTSAIATNVKLIVSWGPSPGDSDFPNTPGEVHKAFKTNEYNLSEVLMPGAFNAVDVVISPAKANELKMMTMKIVAGGVRLKAR